MTAWRIKSNLNNDDDSSSDLLLMMSVLNNAFKLQYTDWLGFFCKEERTFCRNLAASFHASIFASFFLRESGTLRGYVFNNCRLGAPKIQHMLRYHYNHHLSEWRPFFTSPVIIEAEKIASLKTKGALKCVENV